jgi:DNA-binding MarR family transcriptional regulator
MDALNLAWIRRTPGHLIRRSHQVAVALFMEDLADQDITPVQLAALTAVVDEDDLDATRLAELVAFDRSTVGSVLERLETKGWIEREYRDGDRRTKRLHATAAGRAKVRSLTEAMRDSQERLLAVFEPDEQVRFQELLAKFIAAHAPQRAAR